MRYREITEAPITDYDYRDVATDGNNSFDGSDRKLLSSDRHRERMIKAFRNTPHIFEVTFINNDMVDHTVKNITNVLQDYEVGIYDTFTFPHHEPFVNLTSKAGVIQVVLMGNISPTDKIPMTPWTLAHKIGHGFQDIGQDEADTAIHNKIDVIDTLTGTIQGRFQPQQTSGSIDRLTMRSAQSGKLSNPFEVFPEVIAQYLITGRVTIRNDEELSKRLTTEINKLFGMIEGKILVEI